MHRCALPASYGQLWSGWDVIRLSRRLCSGDAHGRALLWRIWISLYSDPIDTVITSLSSLSDSLLSSALRTATKSDIGNVVAVPSIRHCVQRE